MRLFYCGLILALLPLQILSTRLWASGLAFQQDQFHVKLDNGSGRILEIEDLKRKSSYRIVSDTISIELNGRIVNLDGLSYKIVRCNKSGALFRAKSSGFTVLKRLTFPANRRYFNRQFTLKNTGNVDIVIGNVRDGELVFAKTFDEIAFHDDGMDAMDEGSQSLYEQDTPSLYHCSLNLFLRQNDGGLILGAKYPYWKPGATKNDRTSIDYEANYRLKPGSSITLPEVFIGVYSKKGVTIKKEIDWNARVVDKRQEEMDLGEVQAMRQVVRDYLPEEKLPKPGYFLWLNSWWANRDLQGKLGEGEAKAYCAIYQQIRWSRCVDQAIIAPVWMGWAGFIQDCPEIDAVTDDAVFPLNPYIERVLRCAKNNGVALWGFCEPAAKVRHYRQDRPDWKIQPSLRSAKTLNANCQANPLYADWFRRLIESAIDRTGSQGWAWDHCWVRRPMLCYSKKHGHEPGNCEFQQYVEVTGTIRKLRQRYPDRLFEIYWGLKEAGTWSHRGLNSLENLYENNSPAPPGFTAADDQRFQHWYNHNYRFLPTYMNLAQINFEKEGNGELYSILSALSASTHGSLTDWPQFSSQTEADSKFSLLRKWKAWASDNMAYLKDRVDLFGQPCRKGGIDGTAHIVGDRGFIFVFNPCTEAKAGSIPLDANIGLTRKTYFQVTEISKKKNPVGILRRGENLVFRIDAKTALLFQIEPDKPRKARRKLPAVDNPQPALPK